MKPTGRRAWRQAGRRFRKAEKRRGFTPSSSVGAFSRRHWRAVDGNNGIVGKQFPPRLERKPFTARSLVGMTQGARKRLREAIFCGERVPPFILGADSVTEGLRIGKRLRPCPGCFHCQPGVKGWHIDRSRSGRFNMPALALHCDGIGVLPARKQK